MYCTCTTLECPHSHEAIIHLCLNARCTFCTVASHIAALFAYLASRLHVFWPLCIVQSKQCQNTKHSTVPMSQWSLASLTIQRNANKERHHRHPGYRDPSLRCMVRKPFFPACHLSSLCSLSLSEAFCLENLCGLLFESTLFCTASLIWLNIILTRSRSRNPLSHLPFFFSSFLSIHDLSSSLSPRLFFPPPPSLLISFFLFALSFITHPHSLSTQTHTHTTFTPSLPCPALLFSIIHLHTHTNRLD